MIYELEPLEINLTAPAGSYSVTVFLKAHNTTVLSVYEDSAGYIAENIEIAENESRDIIFNMTATDGISIKIYCDGEVTATAMATYIN